MRINAQWICGVVASGHHNGAGCTPSDSHHDPIWGCGWYFNFNQAASGPDAIAELEWKELRLCRSDSLKA